MLDAVRHQVMNTINVAFTTMTGDCVNVPAEGVTG
jgi:hypothetical protein